MIFTEEGNEYMQKFNDATMNMEYSEFNALDWETWMACWLPMSSINWIFKSG